MQKIQRAIYIQRMRSNIKNKICNNNIADGAYCSIEDIKNACILNHFHLLIKRLLKDGKCTDTLIDTIYAGNPSIIIICDEIGSGIVPLEKEDRIYRETVGRMALQGCKKVPTGLERIGVWHRTMPER